MPHKSPAALLRACLIPPRFQPSSGCVFWHYSPLTNANSIMEDEQLTPTFPNHDEGESQTYRNARPALYFTKSDEIFRSLQNIEATSWMRFGHSGRGLIAPREAPFLMSRSMADGPSPAECFMRSSAAVEWGADHWRVSFKSIRLSEFDRIEASIDNGKSWTNVLPE